MNERELHDAVNRLPKSIEPPRDLWPGIEARLARSGAWRRRWYWVPLAAAAVFAFLLIARAERSAWDVTALAGRPLIGTKRLAASGRLRVGDWLQTDDSSRALIAVGRIGQVEVRPDTRLQLVVAKTTEHRLALAHGTIDAKVDAVPRLFFVETPAGTAIDLGCAYTLETDSLGKGLLHVTAGEVEFQTGSRSSRVPLGALMQIRPATGPGIPYVEDAPKNAGFPPAGAQYLKKHGSDPLLSCAYIRYARPICFMLERQVACRAFSRACANTGNRMAARIAIMAITTSNSIRVKAFRTLRREGRNGLLRQSYTSISFHVGNSIASMFAVIDGNPLLDCRRAGDRYFHCRLSWSRRRPRWNRGRERPRQT